MSVGCVAGFGLSVFLLLSMPFAFRFSSNSNDRCQDYEDNGDSTNKTGAPRECTVFLSQSKCKTCTYSKRSRHE